MQHCVAHAVKVLTYSIRPNLRTGISSHMKKIPLYCLPDFKKVPYIKNRGKSSVTSFSIPNID